MLDELLTLGELLTLDELLALDELLTLDKAGAESPYSWGIDLLMGESPKCRMLHGLMRRLAAIKNSDGASERAAVSTM